MSADDSSLTAGDLVGRSAEQLAAITDTARLEAEILVATTAGLQRSSVIARPERPLSQDTVRRVAMAVARRLRGEPIAYILGRKEFYSLPLAVSADVLVPRPETETLVEAALDRLPRLGSRVLDLGTGSGAIALALKHARPDLDVTAVDSSRAALAVARANGAALGLEVDWRLASWFEAVVGERFELVVSNPPYVASADPQFDAALAHEPRVALDGGPEGLDAYRCIFRSARSHLAPKGRLIVEHGFAQRDAVVLAAVGAGLSCEACLDDLAGLPRVACFREVGE